MKQIQLIALTALMTLIGAGPGITFAAAESTALCVKDENACASYNALKHVHDSTLSGAKTTLLTTPTVECDVLFLGDTQKNLAEPLIVEGAFSYTNCGSNCEVQEVSEASVIEILREGEDIGGVTGEWEVHVYCSLINCYYDAEELHGTFRGSLKSPETNGSLSITDHVLKKVKGILCPSTTRLDIVTTPLTETYLTT